MVAAYITEPLRELQAWNNENAVVTDLTSNTRINRYSRFVTLMKWLLPVSALLLFLGLFVTAGKFGTGKQLDITFAEIETIDNDRRMISPRISGVDKKGRPYVLNAETAIQDTDNKTRIIMSKIEAEMLLDDGGDWISLTAESGNLETDMKRVTLIDNVRVYTAWGYEFHAQTAEINLETGNLETKEPVYGQGPVGTLRANSVISTGKGRLIRFTEGVRVVLFNHKNNGDFLP